MTSLTVSVVLNPGAQSARLKSVALLASLFPNRSDPGSLTADSCCWHLGILHRIGKKSNQQGQKPEI